MYHWSKVAELTDEDERAVDEIEEGMRGDWMDQAKIEQAEDEVEDEGEAFLCAPQTRGFQVPWTFPLAAVLWTTDGTRAPPAR
jgi:hypothetical protein